MTTSTSDKSAINGLSYRRERKSREKRLRDVYGDRTDVGIEFSFVQVLNNASNGLDGPIPAFVLLALAFG